MAFVYRGDKFLFIDPDGDFESFIGHKKGQAGSPASAADYGDLLVHDG